MNFENNRLLKAGTFLLTVNLISATAANSQTNQQKSSESGSLRPAPQAVPNSKNSTENTPVEKRASQGSGTTPSQSSSSTTAQTPASAPGPKPGLAVVSGRVTDTKDGRVIEHAEIILTRLGKNAKDEKRIEVFSGEEGEFSIPDLEPGNWSIRASAKDMLSHSTRLELKPGESKNIAIKLEDLENVDIMRVTRKRTLIHPERIGSDTNLDHKFIYQYKTGNDLRDLITSTPGVLNDSYGNIITRGEHNAINYEIDGVVLPEAAGVLQQSQFVSPRSLQNMTVSIGGYEASDGGGPLGAVAHMKSLPILAKPNLNVGHQFGGPLAGTIYYNGSSAFSQDPNSVWNRVRVESSGAFQGSSYRLAPPVKNYVNNNAFDVNSFSKLEFMASEKSTFRITAAVNATISQVPTSTGTRAAGFHATETDGQHYVIASYLRKGDRLFDEMNLHLLNGFYYSKFKTSLAFDPYPNFNAEQPLQSIATTAHRTNYVFSAQGNVAKTLKKEHHLKAGFLTELRPVRTTYNAYYYNADALGSMQQKADAQGQIQQNNADISSTQQSISETTAQIQSTNNDLNAAIAAGNQAQVDELSGVLGELQETLSGLTETLTGLTDNAATLNPNPFPFGALISPYTGEINGTQFLGPVGRYHGFRWLQSAYIQDKYTPQQKFWNRLTLDGGVRFDLQRSIYGNALPLATQMAMQPGVQQFNLAPFQSQHATDAQASGRYGGTFILAKNTVIRGSYSDIFTPTPVDYFLLPIDVTATPIGGIYPGTPRPLRATRGRLIDTSIETQIGPRFSTRTNLFWKYLQNFGDSGVVGNLPLYNRLTNAAQNAYGVETRMDLKSSRDGYGFNGFLSNTIQVAYLRKQKAVSGGFYDFPDPLEGSPKFPDHDRRMSTVVGVGYKSRQNWWILWSMQTLTGLQDSRDVELYGAHHARTPVFNNMSISCGYQPPKRVLKMHPYMPSSIDCRIENAMNQRVPINLGSPFQGTRFSLPIRVLAGFAWQLGPEEAKLSSKPASNSIRTLAPGPQLSPNSPISMSRLKAMMPTI